MIEYICQHCGQQSFTKKFYKIEHNGLTEKYIKYKCECSKCYKWSETQEAPVLTRPAIGQVRGKATKRIPGIKTPIYGRARWESVPTDLHEVLEEERRIREQKELEASESGDDNASEKIESASEAPLD
jgi:protein-arginine kinase activator protein McsA